MFVIVAHNLTASDIVLKQLSVTIPANGSFDLTTAALRYEIIDDPELISLVAAGDVRLEIDGQDLDATQSLSWLSQRGATEFVPPSTICAIKSSQQAFSGATQIVFDSTLTQDSNTFDFNNDEIAIKIDGLYRIDVQLSVKNFNSSSRSQVDGWLELNGVRIVGSDFTMYGRTRNYGATGGCSLILDLRDGDVVAVFARRVLGSATFFFPGAGSRFNIQKLG